MRCSPPIACSNIRAAVTPYPLTSSGIRYWRGAWGCMSMPTSTAGERSKIADYLIGYEANNDVNTAVMKLPADGPLLADLCTIREGWSPPWSPDLPARSLAEYAWGTTGPRALTYYLEKHELKSKALPIDVFYPVHHRQTKLFLDEDLTVEDLITSRTRYIHLYQSSLVGHAGGEPSERSVAGKLIAASGIDDDDEWGPVLPA